jgi:hypothetical protein
MSAFNIVRFHVKTGHDQEFLDAFSQKMNHTSPGLKAATIIKTGDGSYCFIGEWNSLRLAR